MPHRPLPVVRCLRAIALAGCATGFAAGAQARCESVFCIDDGDWFSTLGGWLEGSVLDVRYENIRQDQHRTAPPNNEVSAQTQNLLLDYTRRYASGWGFSVAVPVVEREQDRVRHRAAGDVTDRQDFRGVGAVRLSGRYETQIGDQGRGARSGGVLFGVRLSTSHAAAGDAAESGVRARQSWAVNSDAFLGGFLQQRVPGWRASFQEQLVFQHSLARTAEFAPGSAWTADVGVALKVAPTLTGQLQLRGVSKQRDGGTEALDESGGHGLFLTPGLSWEAARGMRVYVFYQHPLVEHLNGYDVTLRRAVGVGVATRF